MSLSVALTNARASLLTTAKQIAVSGSNINGADDPNYSRRIAQPVTDASGGVSLATIQRADDPALRQRVYLANSNAAGQQALLDGLDMLQATVGDTNSGTSPVARIADLTNALQAQANMPSDPNLAIATLTAARELANSLNESSAAISSARTQADASIADSVQRANNLLAEIENLNGIITRGTFAGRDVTHEMDQRDAAINTLSQEMGLNVVHRPDNDVALYTDGGVTLFDRTARSVTFDESSVLAAGTTGNPVYIDGVAVTGANAPMPLRTGTIAGAAALRDNVATAYEAQIDEIARGLIEATAESDQVGSGADLAGIFTYSGGPALPATGVHIPGIAASIAVNPAADPAQGGNIEVFRDGGINGLNYLYNVSDLAGFADRLDQVTASLNAARVFDPASGLQSNTGLDEFASASIGWLQDLRQTASSAVDYQTTLLGRVSETLSNATGVNIDDEYARQLQLEQSYAASSKLIAIVNEMFDTLMQAVR